MGMSSYISFSSHDVEKRKKIAQQTIDNLTQLDYDIPSELYEIVNESEEFTKAISDINEEACSGFTVDLTKLPKHITIVHFKNCY